MKKGVFLLISTLISLSCAGQDSQSAYTFLRLPVSAHGAALGGENITIIEDDASLLFSNPALLSSVSDRTVGLNYMNYMSGVQSASASYCWIGKKRTTFGVSAQLMDYGKMKEMDANQVELGEFSARDIALGASLCYNLTNRLSGGINAKWVTSYIGGYNSMAMCVDLGLNYYDSEADLSVSLTGRNLGGQLKAFDEEYERLPFELQAGVSKKLSGAPLRFSATLLDLTHWDYKFVNHLAVGVDVLLTDQIWVGAGMNLRRMNEMKVPNGDSESSHGAGLSLGAGIQLERFKLGVAYGKYHVSSSSIIANISFNL